MTLSYDDAVALFSPWTRLKEGQRLPVLEVVQKVRAVAAVHVIAESVSLTEEELTLWFGREAWGGGSVVLPLRKARITVTKPEDNPSALNHPKASQVNRWIQFHFDQDSGCSIIEYKPTMGFVELTGFNPFDITLTPTR